MNERIEGESRDWIKTVRPHLYVLISVAYGATSHLDDEFHRRQSDGYLELFPGGANSLNYTKELAEGGIPSLIGAYALMGAYRLYCLKAEKEPNPAVDFIAAFTGGRLGQISYAIFNIMLSEAVNA